MCDYAGMSLHAGMTPLRARFTLFAAVALFLATAGNALFLQDRPAAPGSAQSGKWQLDQMVQQEPPQAGTQRVPAAPPAQPETREARLKNALQRELFRHGYADQLRAAGDGLRLAILAYEFDNGLALSGEPGEELLKRLLFDINQAPKGEFADRAEANARFVREIQKTLLGLGFFRGTLSGRMDAWTAGALQDFERHRGLAPEGRLTEAAILELIVYSGQPIQLSAG